MRREGLGRRGRIIRRRRITGIARGQVPSITQTANTSRCPRLGATTSGSTCWSNRPRDHSSGYGVRDASTRRQDRRMQDHECKITNASKQDINPESTKLANRLSPRRIHDHRVPLRRPRTAGSKEPQVRLTFRALPDAPTGGVDSPYSASQGADGLSRLLVGGRSTSVDCARRLAMRGLTRTRASPNKDP